MEIFIDSANLKEIESALQRGFPSGITTNPSILAKEPKGNFRDHINKIINLIREYKYDIPLSVEVFTANPTEMLKQAEDFIQSFDYKNLNIKVPIGWDEMAVIRSLRNKNIEVNCTCCMSLNQAYMAAKAGANFVSLFFGRIRDVGYDASSVVRATRQLFDRMDIKSKIIVGSIRHIHDINEAFLAGADIVTVPPKFYPQLVKHPKTDEAVGQFITDFKQWMS